MLHLKIEVANQKKDRDSDKKKKIVFSLNTGANIRLMILNKNSKCLDKICLLLVIVSSSALEALRNEVTLMFLTFRWKGLEVQG